MTHISEHLINLAYNAAEMTMHYWCAWFHMEIP